MDEKEVPEDDPDITHYFDPDDSFYKTYDLETYNTLLEIYHSKEKQQNILNASSFKTLFKHMYPMLLGKNILPLNTQIGKHKLESIMKDFTLPGLLPASIKNMKNTEYALCIEKYYQDSNKIYIECVDDTISQLSTPKLPSIYKTSPTHVTHGLHDTPTYHKFPPGFKEPVFNPWHYPNVLKIYNHFYEYCRDHRNLHNCAGDYYNKMNRRIMVPLLVFSALASIASFVASSEILSESIRIGFTISVGIITSLNGLLQSFSSAYQYGAKASSHFTAADQFDQIIAEINFEKSYPNNNTFFQELEEKIIEVKANCKFLVPNVIKNKYYEKKTRRNEKNFLQKRVVEPIRSNLAEAIIHKNFEELEDLEYLETLRAYLRKISRLEQDLNIRHKSKPCCPLYCPCMKKMVEPAFRSKREWSPMQVGNMSSHGSPQSMDSGSRSPPKESEKNTTSQHTSQHVRRCRSCLHF